MYDAVIIGCGVIGASVAMELSQFDLKILILEKENDICCGTTKANSAIMHAGYDPQAGTLMAQLNVKGNKAAAALCRELDVPYMQIGSLVVAFTEQEVNTLYQLRDRGLANGVEGLKILQQEEVRAMEPHISDTVKAALYAPSAGIIDPWELGIAMAETAVKNGAELRRNAPVLAMRPLDCGWELETPGGPVQGRYVFNAAGVHSDTVHNMASAPFFQIEPCKGSYYLLDKTEGARVNHIIFQCPGPEGKGVLITPTVHGNLIVGPTAEQAADCDNLAVSRDGLEFIKEQARKSVPSIAFEENIRSFAGVRANSTVKDFIIKESAPGFIDVAGMCSPGLASSPAVGAYIADILKTAGLQLKPKQSFHQKRKVIRFSNLTIGEKNALIQKNPAYGRMVCRCETVTEGEIVEALHSPIPACSLDGVKRRTGAGMGRCQGSFCGPKVLEIIARETGCEPTAVCSDKEGSYILTGYTKKGGREQHV